MILTFLFRICKYFFGLKENGWQTLLERYSLVANLSKTVHIQEVRVLSRFTPGLITYQLINVNFPELLKSSIVLVVKFGFYLLDFHKAILYFLA